MDGTVLPTERDLRTRLLLPFLKQPARRAEVKRAAEQLGLSERQVYGMIRILRRAGGDPASLAKRRPGRSSGAAPKSVRAAPGLLETESRLIELIYAAPGTADGWTRVVEAIAHCYPGGRASLALHDQALGQDWEGATAEWEPDRIASYYADYARINPWLPRLHLRPVGRVVPAEFMLPRAELLKSQLYAEFLRPIRSDSGLSVTIQQNGSRAMLLSVVCPSAITETDPYLLQRLQRLVPHLQRAAQLHRQIGLLTARAEAAETAAGDENLAMLLLDAGGRVLRANGVAERIMSAADGLVLRGHWLRAQSAAADATLAQAIDRTARVLSENGGTAPAFRIPRPSGLRDYELLLCPIARPFDLFRQEIAAVALFIRDPELRPTGSSSAMRSLFGLTPAQTRLLDRLLAGESLAEAAENLRIGRESARTLLRGLFSRTGTRRQNELLLNAARCVAAGRNR